MNYLLGLMSGLQICDGIMTDLMVRGNVVQEANKLIEPLVKEGDFLLLKLVGATACVIILKMLSRRFRRAAFITGLISAIFYSVVLGWNVGIILV